jgi:hypothetical protein
MWDVLCYDMGMSHIMCVVRGFIDMQILWLLKYLNFVLCYR